ncbi:P-loop NTPase family protein [Tenacibaculum maritimum]|uniref:hypothetical protein n=1 Tax=Tenacibaculum maritimum TaxID=107401 RepID=UPI0012E598D1|nr:hypothetical protein [Tenacibaculum maritimum]CAA0230157.1 conserved hypothetical protein [Tenacibaculum maritimum]CAA0250079.1 conserved hypothetical protein [Tenacibaculum maritimum]
MIASKDFKKVIGSAPAIPTISKEILWDEFAKAGVIEMKGEKFLVNDDNRKNIQTILRYFAGSEDFKDLGTIKNKPSLSKGLLITGDIGVGKTLMFDILQRAGKDIYKKYNNNRLLFRNISCGNFVNLFMTSTKFSSNLDFNLPSYYKNKLYIDDLGIEPLAFNQYELLESVLFERHRNNALTFITTNLTMTEILKRYGSRIGDRLPQMCNIINWKGKSLRN